MHYQYTILLIMEYFLFTLCLFYCVILYVYYIVYE